MSTRACSTGCRPPSGWRGGRPRRRDGRGGGALLPRLAQVPGRKRGGHQHGPVPGHLPGLLPRRLGGGLGREALAARGVDAILSVHLGSNISGTVNAASLAAAASPVPVRVVDTGSASFGVAFAVWEAAEALAGGASVDEAARLARRVAAVTGNVFVLRGLELARAGGRLAAGVTEAEAIPVLSVVEGVMRPVGRA